MRLVATFIMSGLLSLASCGEAQKGGASDETSWVCVAAGSQSDEVSREYILRVLEHAEVPTDWICRIMWNVRVPEPQADVAGRIIRQKTVLPGDGVYLRGDKEASQQERDDRFKDLTRQFSARVSQTLAQALEKQDADSAAGKIIRKFASSDEWWYEGERYRESGGEGPPEQGITVIRVTWTSRPFVTRSLAPTTALAGEVVLSVLGHQRSYHVSVIPDGD